MYATVRVSGVLRGKDSDEDVYLLQLDEVGGTRRCLMKFDADCIRFISAAQRHTVQDHIPVAHSAVMDLLAMAGLQLHHLVIPNRGGDHYRTILHFQHGHRNVERELMPGDAIAMAIYADCPILIDDEVLNRAHAAAAPLLEQAKTLRRATTQASAEDQALTLPEDNLPQA